MFILVTGIQGSGKSSFLAELRSCLREAGIPAAGILAGGTFKDGVRSSYSLTDISSGKEIPFISNAETPGWEPFRRFWFNPEAWAFGRQAMAGMKNLEGVGIIDEIGPMELEGKGWADVVKDLISAPPLLMVIAVRHQLVNEVREFLGIRECDTWYAGATDPDIACTYIRERLTGNGDALH